MSFNWGKFYDVGLCMKSISANEEYQCSAVGRYYYAAFGLVRNYYEKKYHKIVPTNNSHSFLIKELERSYGAEKSLGENLRKMRKYRNIADYNNKFYLGHVDGSEEIYNEIIKLLEILKD